LCAQFVIPLAANEVIDNRYVMTFGREVEGSRPPAIPVTTKNGNLHVFPLRSYDFSQSAV
jgi:cyclophilin family peptidyl-prolyl cis-trans isomerase